MSGDCAKLGFHNKVTEVLCICITCIGNYLFKSFKSLRQLSLERYICNNVNLGVALPSMTCIILAKSLCYLVQHSFDGVL